MLMNIHFTDCPDLKAPDNGQVIYAISNGSVATYSCHPRYILVGGTNRICIEGSWSPPYAPICEGIYMGAYNCIWILIAKILLHSREFPNINVPDIFKLCIFTLDPH